MSKQGDMIKIFFLKVAWNHKYEEKDSTLVSEVSSFVGHCTSIIYNVKYRREDIRGQRFIVNRLKN